MSNILRTLLAFDGLAAAEEMTGKSYKAGKLRVVRQHQWNSGKSYLQIVDNK